jgi:hypothetical protein
VSRAEKFHLQLVALVYMVALGLLTVLWAVTSIASLLLDSLRYGFDNARTYCTNEFEKCHARVHAAEPAGVRQ